MSEDQEQDPIQRIRDAVEDVRVAQYNLTNFRINNARILNMYDHLRTTLDEARDELAWAIADADLTYVDDPQGDFYFQYTRADRGYYDPERLPPDIRDDPEITHLTVDKKALRTAIERGRIPEDQAKSAWVSNPSKPSVQVKPRITDSRSDG